jgi:hypothetical protein
VLSDLYNFSNGWFWSLRYFITINKCTTLLQSNVPIKEHSLIQCTSTFDFATTLETWWQSQNLMNTCLPEQMQVGWKTLQSYAKAGHCSSWDSGHFPRLEGPLPQCSKCEGRRICQDPGTRGAIAWYLIHQTISFNQVAFRSALGRHEHCNG